MKKLTIVLGLIIVALVIFIATMDLNQYKPKIEQAVKDASGYDLKINGDISTSFSPIGISIADVSLAVPNKKEFASFKSFNVALEFMPLLKQEVKVNYVVLSNLNLTIEKMKNGKFNFDVDMPKDSTKKDAKPTESSKEEAGKLPLVNVTEVRLDKANIAYIDHATEAKASVQNIDVTINDISLDSTKEKLKHAIKKIGERMELWYDFGDDWFVDIKLTDIVDGEEGIISPIVIDGKGFGIIEDCGGAWRLNDIIKAYKTKKSKDYNEIKEWLGVDDFDFSLFDMKEMNERLQVIPQIYKRSYEEKKTPTQEEIDYIDRIK